MDDSPASLAAAVRHDVEPAIEIDLEPVDSVTVVILMDNVTDALMADHGPARRVDPARSPWRPLAMMAEGRVPDSLIAEHGFSVLVTVTKAGQEHRFLFDAGTSPDGVTENMRRLDIDPYSIEAIVCSHGHFDHTTGIDGLIRAVGRLNLPVLIHPHFWRQRRAAAARPRADGNSRPPAGPPWSGRASTSSRSASPVSCSAGRC